MDFSLKKSKIIMKKITKLITIKIIIIVIKGVKQVARSMVANTMNKLLIISQLFF